MTSKMGVDVVVRQTFFGGNYGLLNETFDPMPVSGCQKFII